MKKLIGILMLSGLLVNVPIYGFAQNLALNKPTVTSSVTGGRTGNLAVDGSTLTRWSSAASDPQWIYVDLGNQYNITTVKITWSSAYGKNYTIGVSNNATSWTTIKTITNNTSLTNTNSVTGTGRYVRMYGTARGTTSGYSIYELEVNGSLASCGTPTGLTSSSITTTSATVKWTAVSGAVTYNLQWKASSASTWSTINGITTTSRSLTGLTAGTAYQFQVQTVCSAGSSSYSTAASFTTAASCGTPTGLTSSSITTTSATVSWTAVSGAVTYNLQWKASSSSTWTTVSGITTTSRGLTGLTAGTPYQFQVQTVCSAGSSSFSSAASFTTAASCGIPTGLTSSSITTTSATLSWTAVSAAVTYNLQWKASSASTWTTVSGITTTSSSLTGLTAGTAYQFQVQTVCSGGSGSSSFSSAASFTTAASCGIPTGLTSSSITTTSATLSWTAVSAAVTYNLQWKASSASTWTTVSGITTTSSSLTGLTAGTAYQFQVQTVCSGGSGSSSFSSAASFTTAASCGIPTGLTSSSITTTSATVSWTAVSGAVTYNLQWKASSASTWTTVSGITTTSSSLTGLTTGTPYQFQVQTVCSGGSGSSSYSTAASFTTATSCGIPAGLTSSSITTTSATVSWTAVSGAVTYNLQWKASSASTWTTVSGITTTSSNLAGLTAGTPYQFQVQTVCSGGSGSSSYSTATSFTTAASCGVPTGLTSSSITTTSATVSWTAVSGAATYNLQWKLSSSSTWTTVSGITTTSSDLTGLTDGTAYQFQVQTVCSGGSGSSSYSTAASFTTTASCGIPTGLTSSGITTTTATVSWTAIPNAVTYNLQWKASSSSTWTTVNGIITTSSDLTGLTDGTAYQFQVQTVCSAGLSSYSSSASFTTDLSCGTPTGLTSSSITTASATVSWTAIPNAVTYNLQWKDASSSTWTTVNGITTTSSDLTGLTDGTTYQFRVQTVCSAGSSSYSTSASFTTDLSCGTPTGLTSSSITTASATVSWTAIPNAVTYNLQWKASSSSTWTTVSGITTTSNDLTGLTDGTTYQFQVQTICSAGSSSYSSPASFTTDLSCGTPTGLTSSSITTTSATVNWSAIPNAVTYNLQWKASSSSTWTTVSGITTTSNDLTGLIDGTTYQFRVQTVCSAGSSSYSSSASFTTDLSCGTPTALTSSSITTTSATVNWTAIPNAVTYSLRWKASSSSTWSTVSGITTTSNDLTGLTDGTTYQFQVQTVCSAGSSSYSASASFTTDLSCGTPTGLTSSSVTNTSATVSWTAVPGAATYNLQWKDASSSTWTTVSGITATSSDLTGLTDGTTYQFQVQTVCSAGSSSYSASTSFTTDLSCGTPTGLISSSVTNASATVSWSDIPNAVTYNLQWKASSSSTWTTVNGITTTSSDLTGLTDGTTYQFRVQTVCSAGSSSYSASTSFTTDLSCGTPTGLTSSSVTNASTTVSWTTVPGAATYNLQWKDASSSTWTPVNGITTTSSDLTGLTDGTTYQFQVQAICSAGSSSYSATASFTTDLSCGTPTGLNSSGVTNTSATVSWTAIPNAVTYNLQWKSSSSSTWTTVNGITTTSSDLTGLAPGTTCQFQVQTICSAGSSSYSSPASLTTMANCGTPTGLTSSSITNTSATVSWTAIPDALTYNLQWKASSSSTWTTVNGIATTSSNLSGLTAATTYQFQVQTVCSYGSGSYSDPASLTTTANCGTPTGLTSSGVTNTSATVSWTAISDAVTYNLQWKASASSTWTTVSGITTTSSNLTGLTAGTTYQFQVQTICSYGSSSYSDAASFATTSGGTGKTYYVSSTDGDDSRTSTQAQSSSTPWKTLSKLNSFFSSLQPGDNVYFKRGDTFYGSITASTSGISGSSISFDAYGTGNKPIITGFTDVTSWSNVGNNLWMSSNSVSSLATLNIVAINGSFAPIGKWPTNGYNTLTQSNVGTSITHTSLTSNWTGGTVVIRKNHWIIDKSTITSQSGTTINFSNPTSYTAASGWGWFIQNHQSACDAQNEWWYDASSKKIGVYSSGTPSGVQVSTVDNLVSIGGNSFLSFNNISFQGSNSSAVTISSGNNIKFDGCDFLFQGINGFTVQSSAHHITLNNCTANYTNNDFVTGGGSANWTITNNVITNTAQVAGMGSSADGNYIALYNMGANSLIQYNVIRKTGYSGIDFRGAGISILNNVVDTFCNVKDDGGGIYTYTGTSPTTYATRSVDHNIVLNGGGASAGTNTTNSNAYGIYMDDNSSNVTVTNNSVANCGAPGMFLHAAHDMSVTNNTLYNNVMTGGYGQILVRQESFGLVRNLTLTGNVAVSRSNTQLVAYYWTNVNDFNQWGTIDNNYYCRPLSETTTFSVVNSSGTQSTDLTGWQSISTKDINSKKSPVSITNVNSLRFEYNSTSSNKTINLGAAYVDAKGVSVPTSITLAPYTSIVLILASGGTTQAVTNTEQETNLNEKPSFVIYPNPVRDNFVLQLNNSQMGKMNVQVVNQAGAIIRSYLFNKDRVLSEVTMPSNDLPAGVYVVHVQIGTWSDRRKIVKL